MKKTCTFLIALSLMIATLSTQATVIYTEMNLTATQTSTWVWFEWLPDTDGFGLWVVPGASLRLETYQDMVIGYDDGGMTFLSAVPYESIIGPGSNWLVPSVPSYINDQTHTDLNGTTFYAGVQLRSADNEIYYGWMQFSVASDGLSFTLIDMAYEDEPGVELMVGLVDKQVVYETETFTEDLLLNNGTMMNQVPVQLLGVNFSVSSGSLTENTHYTTENVPDGLTLDISVIDATYAVMTFSGQALAHEMADTVDNLTINFLDAVFDGVPAIDIINAEKTDLFIKFFGAYELVYEDLPDEVCGFGGWLPFQNFYFENYFGIWHDGTNMRLETYGKDVIGTSNSGMSFVTPLVADAIINAESPWVESGFWPNESYLTTAGYTDWNGQDKFAGIKLELGDAIMYGWVRLGVSADGTEVTLYEWAFNSAPDMEIKAGQKENTGVASWAVKQLDIYPNPCREQLMISSRTKQGLASIEVLDLLGNTWYLGITDFNGRESTILDMSRFQEGLYFLQITCEGQRYVQKFIKE